MSGESLVLKERKENQEVDFMTLVLELYKDHQGTQDLLDLKETQSEAHLDPRAHQEHPGLVMMVDQVIQDLLDHLVHQGPHHCQDPIGHHSVFLDLQVLLAHLEFLALDQG